MSQTNTFAGAVFTNAKASNNLVFIINLDGQLVKGKLNKSSCNITVGMFYSNYKRISYMQRYPISTE